MNHESYTSPFAWRYGREELRKLFAERERRRLWRLVWVALAESQSRSGLVTEAELADIKAHANEIDIDAALEIEREIGHDLMAEIRVFASQATIGGGKIHLGATSMDIEDTVEMFRIRRALDVILPSVDQLLRVFAEQIARWSHLVCMGYTHIQPAEPTTVGYRLALYAQDVSLDRAHLHFVRDNLTAKGIRGPVGTSAAYADLLAGGTRTPRQQEEEVLSAFDLRASEVGSQTYPRKLDYLLLSALAGLGASLSKFALDVRVLSSPAIGEMFEPFGERQVGSSSMPFKRNPILSERIGSLARLLPAYADVAFANAATNMLERTLDDSANRRTIMPEALLCTDEIVGLALRVARGLRVDEGRISQNLRTFGPFAGTETVMAMAAKAGANRQELHESIRRASMQAWEAIARGEVNPLARILADDESISQYIDPAEIRSRLDPSTHIGDAPERAENLAKQIVETIATP